MRKLREGKYAYFFRRVGFGSGVLLLPPAEETVDPAHVVVCVTLAPCRCRVVVGRRQIVRLQYISKIAGRRLTARGVCED
jgi:hypothetical protein